MTCESTCHVSGTVKRNPEGIQVHGDAVFFWNTFLEEMKVGYPFFGHKTGSQPFTISPFFVWLLADSGPAVTELASRCLRA